MKKPPSQNELEVSAFGPGYGECIVVHLGYGEWAIIDSCIDNFTNFPAALSYLNEIGVNPKVAVKIVVATHWHDDHIRGLGAIVSSCENAEFVCSNALLTKEFVTLVKAYGETPGMAKGVKEFDKVIEVLEERKQPPNICFCRQFLST